MLRRIPRPLALLLAARRAAERRLDVHDWRPFQGPDEPAHFSYTQYLAETGHRPSVTAGDHPDSTQVGGALVLFNLDQLAGVADARPAWTKLEERRYDDILDALGEKADEDGAGPEPDRQEPAAVLRVPGRAVLRRLARRRSGTG